MDQADNHKQNRTQEAAEAFVRSARKMAADLGVALVEGAWRPVQINTRVDVSGLREKLRASAPTVDEAARRLSAAVSETARRVAEAIENGVPVAEPSNTPSLATMNIHEAAKLAHAKGTYMFREFNPYACFFPTNTDECCLVFLPLNGCGKQLGVRWEPRLDDLVADDWCVAPGCDLLPQKECEPPILKPHYDEELEWYW